MDIVNEKIDIKLKYSYKKLHEGLYLTCDIKMETFIDKTKEFREVRNNVLSLCIQKLDTPIEIQNRYEVKHSGLEYLFKDIIEVAKSKNLTNLKVMGNSWRFMK